MQIPPLPSRETVQEAAQRILASPDFRRDAAEESRLLAGVWRKLREWFDTLGGLHEAAPVLYWTLLIGCSLLLAAILIHVGLVIYRVARRSPERKGPRGPGQRDPGPAEVLESARRAAATGAVAEALTLYLKAALSGLDQRKLLRRSETATVREYAAMLRGRPAELKDYTLLVSCYEPAVFGHRAPAPGALSACDAAVEAMIRHAH